MQPVVNYWKVRFSFVRRTRRRTGSGNVELPGNTELRVGTTGGAKVRTLVQKRPLSLIRREHTVG
jgi:hypothetical protein